MKKTLTHYLKTYWGFVSTSTTMAMSFRASFLLLIIMDLTFYFSAISSIEIIYNHVAVIGPWKREQLLFFITFMLAIDHLHMTFLSESFWELSLQLRTGQLDFVLLRPIHSLFGVFFRYFRPSSLLNIFVIWGALIYYGRQIPLQWWQWPLLPILILLGFCLLAVIEILISTLMFWTQEGLGINFLRMQMQNLSRWPDFIYGGLSRKVLTVAIPLLLIGSPAVHFLYDPTTWPWLLVVMLAIAILFALLLWVWNLALKNYESASS